MAGRALGHETQRRTPQWRRRPLATVGMATLIATLPWALAVGAGVLAARALVPHPQSLLEKVAGVLVGVSVSSVVLFGVERAARRLLPLVMLLRLSLTFPDRAPSRLAIALRAGNLRRARVRPDAESAEPITAQGQAEVLLTLVAALNAHDRRTRGHSERVRAFTDLVAEEMDLAPEEANSLRWAALLHDIGKLDVPADILNKRGALDAAELAIMSRHPEAGARLAGPLAEWLGEWHHAIDQHHEKFDGTGYPRRLAGHDISEAGRIVSVTDSFETMTAVRSYKKAMPVREAREELVRAAGSHFDPDVVRAFFAISLPRLYRVIGPLAIVADIPLLARLSNAGTRVIQAAGAFAVPALAGTLALAVNPAVAAPANADVTARPAVAVHGSPAPTSPTAAPPDPTRPSAQPPGPSSAFEVPPVITGLTSNLPQILSPLISTLTPLIPTLPTLPISLLP